MAIPTDRGYAVLSDNDDGTVTVMVCTAIEEGEPVDVFAMHVRAPAAHVTSGVRMVGAGSQRHTRGIVEVFSDPDGAVYLRAPSRRKGPLRIP